MLTNLLQRSKENDVVTGASDANNISVVDYAIAPEGPVGPNRMRGVMMAFLLSLGLGMGLALFLEYLDDTVHSTDEVERFCTCRRWRSFRPSPRRRVGKHWPQRPERCKRKTETDTLPTILNC